ncbi:unnamed protein product [Caenorhabditis brenneri]
MSDTSTGDPGKLMKKPSEDLSKAIKQTSVATSKISSSSKNLSDRPIDIVGMIIERSDYKRQLILRKVSKTLRTLVDNQKPACKSIKVHFHPLAVHLSFDDHVTIYVEGLFEYEKGASDADDVPDYCYDIKKVLGADFKEVAFQDLVFTLKNPKLQLDSLTVAHSFNQKEAFDEYLDDWDPSFIEYESLLDPRFGFLFGI